MPLSSDLISQFAKIVNSNNNNTKTEETVYGTVKVNGDKKTVELDGSNYGYGIPLSSTTDVKDGDRVTVMIKDHAAVVTGNLSAPSINKETTIVVPNGNGGNTPTTISEFGNVVAKKIQTEYFSAEQAKIYDLYTTILKVDEATLKSAIIEALIAKNAEFEKVTTDVLDATFVEIDGELVARNAIIEEKLEATEAEFRKVESDFIEVNGKISANEAELGRLEADKADISWVKANTADITWSNIDFSNIKQATIGALLAQSGIIQNLTVGDATITGELVGITISGDLIKGGKVVADNLLVLGEDGLYYKLNVSGETIEAEQTAYNSLSGSVITAKSVTAEKIRVQDIEAFGATIGGFNLSTNALYSGVKNSVDNTTLGIYMDPDAQFALGDSTNFLKFYKVRRYRKVDYADNIYTLTDEYIESPYVNTHYKVNYVDNVYIETTDVINSVNGEPIDGVLTDQGSQVFLDSTSGTYYYTATIDGDAVEGALIDPDIQIFKGLVDTDDETIECFYIILDSYRLDVSASSISFSGGESVELAVKGAIDKTQEVNDNLSTQINNNYSDYQGFAQKFSKYINFLDRDENGNPTTAISIGSGDSALTIEIDNNNGLIFKNNGKRRGYWDGSNMHTDTVDVGSRIQSGNFADIVRSDGSMTLLKVR